MFTNIFFLSHFFPFGDESDNDGSGSGSSGTRAFLFFFENFVGRVRGVGSGVLVPTFTISPSLLGDVVPLLIEFFFPLKISNFSDTFKITF